VESTVATDKKKISAYLEESVKEDAEKLAKLEKRSLSNLVEVLIEDAIAKAKKDGRL
jgi:macrodomain Ter protein organizer (MatP/YcbG family)